ncbi:MAG TPA: hypothetical protein VKS03_07390, partial [Thermoanaerobaculia bacterium]|nr:hypothetical protein [Thermoanaerobaculia bacterium]
PATQGPFDFSRREPAVSVPRGAPAPQPVVTPAPPQFLVPGGLPNDPFRPTPNPREAIPPQPTPGAVPQSSKVAPPGTDGSVVSTAADAVALDFDPPSVSLSPGEQKTVMLRATGSGSAPPTTLGIQFDPAVVAVVAVRPILSAGGSGDANVSGGRVVLELPGGVSLAGTRPVAEITLRGMGAGRSKLSFEKPSNGGVLAAADAAVEVRSP